MKRCYVATAPDGREFERRTERTYTHAVICHVPAENRWGIVSFAGSARLAAEAADRWNRHVHVHNKPAQVVPAVKRS